MTPSSGTTTIAVLIACHNRKALTLECLGHLMSQELPPRHELRIWLVDDGSTDGTAEAVGQRYPEINILKGDGSLFWCNGMRLAWENAARSHPDFYLWLNDDTMLLPGALVTLLKLAERPDLAMSVLIGSCRDARTGAHTYGGFKLHGIHPARGRLLPPDPVKPINCDVINGNCVLISKKTYELVGGMGSFQHSMGDLDYGLRARSKGVPRVLAPGFLAECSCNPEQESWQNRELPRSRRLKLILSRKGLPPLDYWRLLWEHAGLRALIYWPRPYLSVLAGR